MTDFDTKQTIKNWFEKLEVMLTAEAELAGLLGHGTMVGSAREFLVQRVLKTVLPPEIHIGSGIVISPDNDKSKQIDIILYDAAFPIFETQSGLGLYLAEGVVAAIEVKSTLDKKKLEEALANCESVSKIRVSGLSPRSYIFGFKSEIKRIKTFTKYVQTWWDSKNREINEIKNCPRVIVAGHIAGVSGEAHYTPTIDETKLENAFGKGARFAVAVWTAESRFGWLLTDLLLSCANRKSGFHGFSVNDYLPISEIWDELIGKTISVVGARNT